MAGDLKPSPELNEASYTVNAYDFDRNYSSCPLFDGKVTSWRGGGDAYWLVNYQHPNESYLDITINCCSNIYRLSQKDYYDRVHQEPFTIFEFIDGGWANQTEQHQQTLNYECNSWIKTMSKLEKGRYKFVATCRMDAEWFIEKAKNDHVLYLKDNAIYGMKAIQ